MKTPESMTDYLILTDAQKMESAGFSSVPSNALLKARVSEILHEALRGYDVSTRYRNEAGYVRWVLVEQDIHAAIDEANAPAEARCKASPPAGCSQEES